jgi:hypothetical protein
VERASLAERAGAADFAQLLGRATDRGLMISKSFGFYGLVVISAMFLGGCASGASAAGMTVKAADLRSPTSPEVAQSMGVGDVVGGEETDAMGASQIDNPQFKKALVKSLLVAGLLAMGPVPKYVVTADLVMLKQPVAAMNMTVTSRVRYKVKDYQSGAVVFDEEILAAFTAKPADSLIGVERLRLANEGSARKSIAMLIEKLNAGMGAPRQAKVPSPSPSPAPLPSLAVATHTL